MPNEEMKKHRARRVLYMAAAAALLIAMLVPVFMKLSGTAASVWELLAFTVMVWCWNAAKNERLLMAKIEKDNHNTSEKG